MKLRVVVGCALVFLAVAGVADAAGARHGTDSIQRRIVVLGRSVDGRRIVAVETGDFDSPRKALVVGCIHGNECAGIAISTRLARTRAPSETDLWIVGDLNPDGEAAGTRGNAHAVDLNRNFPWRWQHLSGIYDSGPFPLSERESRVAVRLIRRLRPIVSIWFHQHLDLVDDSGGSVAIERRFAMRVRLRLARLVREPGSAVTWENHCYRRGTAFVVELPEGRLDVRTASRFAAAARGAFAAATSVRPVAAPGCDGAR